MMRVVSRLPTNEPFVCGGTRWFNQGLVSASAKQYARIGFHNDPDPDPDPDPDHDPDHDHDPDPDHDLDRM